MTYRSTESRYKGGADEMYVTYDLRQKSDGLLPRVKRVYIAGDVKDWDVGDFEMRSGRTAHGVCIEYEQSRKSYTRQRDGIEARVPAGSSLFTKVVEVPDQARNVAFHRSLPARYRSALQDVR